MAVPLIARRVATLAFLCSVLAGIGVVTYLLWLAWSLNECSKNYTEIDDGLFMGGDEEVPPFGTKAVLNLCEHDDAYRTEVYRWEPIPDNATPLPDSGWLRRMVEFIDENHRAGRKTYVHCRNGVSRSGMVVVAYEMFKHHWTRDQALEYVRSKRPLVRPNPAFMERLLEWELEKEKM
jgi:hypothetical protein